MKSEIDENGIEWVDCVKPGYKKRLDKQTLEWLNGNPKHNHIDDECCPDFSCCNPSLLAPKEVREKYCRACANDEDGYSKGINEPVNEMLGDFLDAMLDQNLPGTKVKIIK